MGFTITNRDNFSKCFIPYLQSHTSGYPEAFNPVGRMSYYQSHFSYGLFSESIILGTMMLEKVKRTIHEHSLVAAGDAVLVALSGGPDSVALLHILSRLRKRMKVTLAALYVNHQIRPRAAKQEEGFCQKLCDKLGVTLTIERADIPALARKQKKGLEETARDFRYALFENQARLGGYGKIALGHHIDDRVETILFRILRGTGRTGLRGMPIKRGKIIRPLYHVTKEEIYVYLKRHRLPFCIDQSNTSCDFARNYIRNKLLVDIRKRLNPAVDAALLNLSEITAEEESFLQQFVSRVREKISGITVGGKIELDLRSFSKYDRWLRRRLLRHCLTETSGKVSAFDKAVVDRLDKLCLTTGKAVSLPDHVQAVRVSDKLIIYRKGSHSFYKELKPGQITRLPGLRLNLRCKEVNNSKGAFNIKRRSKQVRVDREKLSFPLFVRHIMPGDRFTPLGVKGTKKVGDYLTDRKVAPVFRDEIPVVCDQEGIVWLVGFEIADRVKIDSSTGRVIEIEVSERRKNPVHAV
jgi:tRNA(Ile)-lysidine synthase